MELKFIKLEADCVERQFLEQLNSEAFPPSERMSMEDIFSFAVDTDTDVLGIYDGRQPIGFAVLLKNAECGYIYFLAIDRRLRSKGYGSAAVAKLLHTYPSLQFVLDFEEIDPAAPNNDQRLRRKQFYLRNGFHETGRYTLLRNERFEVVCSGGALRADALRALLHVIHTHRPDFPDVLI